MNILTMLLRCCWIMKSTANQCAFVRAEFVEILLLLLQWKNSCKLPQSDCEEELYASKTVSEVSVDVSVGVGLDVAGIQFLDETVNSEVRLLLKFDGPESPCQTEVRILH